MKKVMVLGAGRGQIPIMNLCKGYGWFVIAVSPDGDYPGLKVADKVIIANVKDYEQVYLKAKEEKVDAILTDQLDAGVYTASYVAEKLGLKGIGTDAALRFTNKYEMRKAAKNAGISVPESICAASFEDAKRLIDGYLTFPLMMKPVDSAASRGVYKVNSLAELEEKFEDSIIYSKSNKIIIEQFISGKEYVVEAFTRNYNTTNLVVGHRDYFNIPETFIPNATVFVDSVSAESELEKRLKEINKKLVESFELPFGITHAEYLYNEHEDKIYLVEIAARGGGVFISSELIPAACGVNANDLLVKEALCLDDNDPIVITSGASAYFCYLTPEGVVTRLDGIDKVEGVKGVRKAFFDNIFVGMKTRSIRDKSSRKGPILVQGQTKEDCYKTIKNVKDLLEIEITDGNCVKNAIWN